MRRFNTAGLKIILKSISEATWFLIPEGLLIFEVGVRPGNLLSN
jgi:hypothetical protein